ncbi:9032_t:CDS:2, partial [Gigaspora rosea]
YVRKSDTTNETVYHLNVPNVDVKDTIALNVENNATRYDMNIDMIFRIAKVLLKQTTLTINEALRERQEDKYSLEYEDANNYYPDESGYYHPEHIEETENREFPDLAEALERSLETFTE